MGNCRLLFLIFVCVASAYTAGWLFLNSQHTNIAWLLAFMSVASTAKLVQELENETPYQRGLAAANDYLASRNRRTR